jgi:trans-aconitate methyltransferase
VSTCHLCGFDEVSALPSYEALHRVTSDCKPWPPGGQLGVCSRCGSAQAIISPQWEEEARKIYDHYTIYHQSGGAEQSVLDATTGAASSRSSRLLRRLNEEFPLPSHGRLLDVGCGNGTTLRAFNEIAPRWSLAGLDVTDHCKAAVEAIPGVEALYTVTAGEVPGQFQLITLIHSLEHIADPTKFLAGLWDKLVVGGMLVVQVPDCWQNPFMFLVADHATHFFKSTLCATVTAGGYEVAVAADDWVAKELTVVARKTSTQSLHRLARSEENTTAVTQRLQWLTNTVCEARALAKNAGIALFGTSIAATWLTAELGKLVAFYLDEDPHRAGHNHLGRVIYPPGEAPAGIPVLIALPPAMAASVKERLERLGTTLHFHVPPPLPLLGRDNRVA